MPLPSDSFVLDTLAEVSFLRLLTLLALTLVLLACAHQQRQAQTSQSDMPRGTVLVKQLPAGAEGLELKEGSLRLRPGYNFVKQSGHRFAVARMSGASLSRAEVAVARVEHAIRCLRVASLSVKGVVAQEPAVSR